MYGNSIYMQQILSQEPKNHPINNVTIQTLLLSDLRADVNEGDLVASLSPNLSRVIRLKNRTPRIEYI